ncbi:hypothetical protein BgiMline_003288 [Biomphalaria glabrata]
MRCRRKGFVAARRCSSAIARCRSEVSPRSSIRKCRRGAVTGRYRPSVAARCRCKLNFRREVSQGSVAGQFRRKKSQGGNTVTCRNKTWQ